MSININDELSQIGKNRYGIDIRMPIYEALRKLAQENDEKLSEATDLPLDFLSFTYPDITSELEIIENDPKGARVKGAIHDALFKLSIKIDESNPAVMALEPYSVDVTPVIASDADLTYARIGGPGSGVSKGEYLSALYEAMVSAISDLKRGERLWTAEQMSYEEEEGLHTLTISTRVGTSGWEPFVRITETFVSDWNDWCFQITVIDDEGSEFTYPATTSVTYEMDKSMMGPKHLYVSKNKVCIRTSLNAILFAKDAQSNASVAFGCGDRAIPPEDPSRTDPSSEIRAFSTDTIFDGAIGVGSYYRMTSDKLVIVPLLTEASESWLDKGYAVLTDMSDGEAYLGSRRLIIAGHLAFEVEKKN